MATTFQNDEKDCRSYKSMLIYEMHRSERLEHDLRSYQLRVKNLLSYIDILEHRLNLY